MDCIEAAFNSKLPFGAPPVNEMEMEIDMEMVIEMEMEMEIDMELVMEMEMKLRNRAFFVSVAPEFTLTLRPL